MLLGSRDLARGEIAAREIGSNVIPLQLDVTDETSVTTAAERVRSDFGRLDVLVQNAAIATALTGEVTSQQLAQAGRPSYPCRTYAEFGILMCSEFLRSIRQCCPYCA